MDSDVTVTGVYIQSMVKSAGEVSPVFEKKMKELLAEHGIEDPEPDGWYSAEAFIDAVNQASERIGSKTIAQAGEEMGRDVPSPEGATSPHDVLQIIDHSQQEAYKGGTEERPAGGYNYERIDDTTARVGVTEKFPYPEGIAKGAPVGMVKDMVDREGTVSVETVDTKPVEDREKGEEKDAYKISW